MSMMKLFLLVATFIQLSSSYPVTDIKHLNAHPYLVTPRTPPPPPPYQPLPHNTLHALFFDATRQAYVYHAFAVLKVMRAEWKKALEKPSTTMFSTYGVFPLLILMAVLILMDAASEKNQGRNDIQTYRSIGLEEMALFLIGLGVATAFGLAVLMGPLFALLYTTLNATNGVNSISTAAGGKRVLESNLLQNKMLEKLMNGLDILDDVLKKYPSI